MKTEGLNNTSDFISYEDFLSKGNTNFEEISLEDEWNTIAINYTSGTTETLKVFLLIIEELT